MTLPITYNETRKLKECYKLRIYVDRNISNKRYISIQKHTFSSLNDIQNVFRIEEITAPDGKLIGMFTCDSIRGNQIESMLDIISIRLILENRAKSLNINSNNLINIIVIDNYLNKRNILSNYIWQTYVLMNAYVFKIPEFSERLAAMGEFHQDDIANQTSQGYKNHKMICEKLGCENITQIETKNGLQYSINESYIITDNA